MVVPLPGLVSDAPPAALVVFNHELGDAIPKLVFRELAGIVLRFELPVFGFYLLEIHVSLPGVRYFGGSDGFGRL